ncbi:MAG: hypothetical protein ACJAS4_002554 [Bacteriovoracaceae bacterium]|jgi:hypothetical protein
MKKYYEIDEYDFLEKKLSAAKEILPLLISQQATDYTTDVRKRASLIYNCVAIAGDLLDEVGFVVKGTDLSDKDPDHERTAIRKLSELLKEDKS